MQTVGLVFQGVVVRVNGLEIQCIYVHVNQSIYFVKEEAGHVFSITMSEQGILRVLKGISVFGDQFEGAVNGVDKNRYVRVSALPSSVAEFGLKRIPTGIPRAHSASGYSNQVQRLMYPSSRTMT